MAAILQATIVGVDAESFADICAQRMARVCDALAQYRQLWGEYPATLDELVPEILGFGNDIACPSGDPVFAVGGDLQFFQFEYRRFVPKHINGQDYVGWMSGGSLKYGEVVPLLRCPQRHFELGGTETHHNASLAGRVFRSKLFWELEVPSSGDVVNAMDSNWGRQLAGAWSQAMPGPPTDGLVSMREHATSASGLPWFFGSMRNRVFSLGERYLPLSGRGVFCVNGIEFLLDGVIQLDGGPDPLFETESGDIPVSRRVSRIHVLHGALEYAEGDSFRRVVISQPDPLQDRGVPVLAMAVHYSAVGDVVPTSETLRFRYLIDTAPFMQRRGEGERFPKAVWEGGTSFREPGAERATPLSHPLFLTTWINPHPDEEIHSLSFRAPPLADLPVAPFVVSISVE